MIISWFTNPGDGVLSSYYQYDNLTRQFVRIRLELGRTDANDASDTVVNYQPERVVGFSKQDYLGDADELDPADWSVNDGGELCYRGTPLPGGRPPAGDYVYDASIGTTFPHAGSPVTVEPVLPEGIEPRHLALLANDAVANRARTRVLTKGSASTEELADAIKENVCRVLKVEDFTDVNDDVILQTLTEQIRTISANTSVDAAHSVGKELVMAERACSRINGRIADGVITPNKAFIDACASFQQAIKKSLGITGEAADARRALAEIRVAQQEVNKAIETIDAAKFEDVIKELNLAHESLNQAQKQTDSWEAAKEEYEPLAEAKSLEGYERELGFPETEEVVTT